jgi:hypothetical protein
VSDPPWPAAGDPSSSNSKIATIAGIGAGPSGSRDEARSNRAPWSFAHPDHPLRWINVGKLEVVPFSDATEMFMTTMRPRIAEAFQRPANAVRDARRTKKLHVLLTPTWTSFKVSPILPPALTGS